MIIRNRDLLVAIVFFLFVAMFCPFLLEIQGGFSNYSLDVSAYYYLIPITLALLFLSPLLRATAKYEVRLSLALWLVLFLWSGFNQILQYNYPVKDLAWIVYPVYGLLIGVALFVLFSSTVASLGPIKLTVLAGFILVISYHLLSLIHSFYWFGIYTHSRVGMWVMLVETDWISSVLIWLGEANWISYRLITYVCLGYLLVRHKGFLLGVSLSVFIALADSTFGWLISLPRDGEFEHVLVNEFLQNDLNFIAFLRAVLAQVAGLTVLALAGALVASIPWRPRFQRRIRSVAATGVRQRPARQLTTTSTLLPP